MIRKTTLQISYQFLSHKQFPGNQHKSQVNIGGKGGGGGGEEGAAAVKECGWK